VENKTVETVVKDLLLADSQKKTSLVVFDADVQMANLLWICLGQVFRPLLPLCAAFHTIMCSISLVSKTLILMLLFVSSKSDSAHVGCLWQSLLSS